ncbi:MAG: sigma-54-dependent transcriptional regulator [Chitinophagaceae bacterium]
MKSISILVFIVEDDLLYSSMLAHYLSLNPDYQVKKFLTAADFLNALHEKPDIITLDYSLPDATGEELIAQIKELSPDTKIIIVSGQDEIKVAIELFKKGVHDYIVKDNETQDRLWISMQNLHENIELRKELESLQQEVSKKYNFQTAIVGNSTVIKQIFALIEKASRTNITVSISGETGTGKELVAKAIHYNSDRKNKSFVPVNVAAIPPDLLESELFGHEKGAFTGAINQRIGKFEEANKGTIFLDEIAEMDFNLQAKLLRVLQEKEVTPIGSNRIIKIDSRIIVATNKNLAAEVKKGRFREDLYYRILGLPITLPPLRERENDILLIARYFIEAFCKENKLPKKNISLQAKKQLLQYNYPGNIRELKSIIELACVFADEDEIQPEHIQISNKENNLDLLNEQLSLHDFNIQFIQHHLNRNNYDILKVASQLNIGKSTIYRMIQRNELKLQKSTNKI